MTVAEFNYVTELQHPDKQTDIANGIVTGTDSEQLPWKCEYSVVEMASTSSTVCGNPALTHSKSPTYSCFFLPASSAMSHVSPSDIAASFIFIAKIVTSWTPYYRNLQIACKV